MRRIGFAGTLDPLASGLMIVAVGEATKLLYDLEQTDKVYDVVIKLGATSETYDAEGPIHEVSDSSIPLLSQIQTLIEDDFSGEKMQVPPRYSAVKIGGKRSYDLARGGQDVPVPAKKVTFFDVKVNRFEYPLLDASVHCSAGTYIRSFAHDLGQKLGCGAYVQDLRRTKIGRHLIQDAVPLSKITKENFAQLLISPEVFLKDWIHCDLTEPEYNYLQLGGFIQDRWGVHSSQVLGVFKGQTVGLIEPANVKGMIKFAKRFNLS